MWFERERRGGVGERWRFGEEGGERGEGSCSAEYAAYISSIAPPIIACRARRVAKVICKRKKQSTRTRTCYSRERAMTSVTWCPGS